MSNLAMINRDMLMSAASSIELECEWNACSGAVEYIPKGSRHYARWEPHKDDATSFLLAIRLGILSASTNDRYKQFQVFYREEMIDNDYRPSEAAKRAIVRVASLVGNGELNVLV